MNAEGGSSRALAGGGDSWVQPNWRVDYSYSSSRGSSSYTSTQGTAYSTPSSNTSVGLDLSCRDGVSENKLKYLLEELFATKDVSILDRWRSEVMGAAATSLLHFAASWIRALTMITESIVSMFLTDMLGPILEEEEEEKRHVLYIDSARFAEACFLKMLPFVDALVAPYSCGTRGCEIVVVGDGAPAPAEKLRALILVHGAVSRASTEIRFCFYPTSFEEAKRITDEIANLLLAKEAKLDEAIWSAVEETTARLQASADDDDSWWWGTQAPQVISPDIHKVTRAIISYINILRAHCTTMHRIVDQTAQLRRYVPKIGHVRPLTSLMMETVSCLEEKLAEKSRLFPDQSLRFLFLINNSNFIWQQLQPAAPILVTHKIDEYIETYLQVSWAPVLSCLCNSTPLCLGKYPSPAKFEAEFLKTYAAQKLWKVPDPKLRRRLRGAVIDRVIPKFTKYLEDNNISPSGITPRDLKDMLEELFEG